MNTKTKKEFVVVIPRSGTARNNCVYIVSDGKRVVSNRIYKDYDDCKRQAAKHGHKAFPISCLYANLIDCEYEIPKCVDSLQKIVNRPMQYKRKEKTSTNGLTNKQKYTIVPTVGQKVATEKCLTPYALQLIEGRSRTKGIEDSEKYELLQLCERVGGRSW